MPIETADYARKGRCCSKSQWAESTALVTRVDSSNAEVGMGRLVVDSSRGDFVSSGIDEPGQGYGALCFGEKGIAHRLSTKMEYFGMVSVRNSGTMQLETEGRC